MMSDRQYQTVIDGMFGRDAAATTANERIIAAQAESIAAQAKIIAHHETTIAHLRECLEISTRTNEISKQTIAAQWTSLTQLADSVATLQRMMGVSSPRPAADLAELLKENT